MQHWRYESWRGRLAGTLSANEGSERCITLGAMGARRVCVEREGAKQRQQLSGERELERVLGMR